MEKPNPFTEVEFIESKLKGKEKEFCVCFAETGDAELSARLAGFSNNPASKGMKLLARDDILNEIERLIGKRKKIAKLLAFAGYCRLAFGDTADAVSLLFDKNPADADLSALDLFMISEIKKPKDGSVEIKFFDRLKALEKLENLSGENTADNLFDAIGGVCGGSGRDD